jgi:hypothetical protein
MALLLRVLIGLVVVWAPAAASAEIAWQFGKRGGRGYLQAMSTEPERDTEFWARCRPDGAIDIGIGADSSVGTGKGEAVTLMLASGGVMAKLTGSSRDSANFQMTGGAELRARVSRNDAVFNVLSTGKPIQVRGAIKPITWPAKGLKSRVAAFLKACQ